MPETPRTPWLIAALAFIAGAGAASIPNAWLHRETAAFAATGDAADATCSRPAYLVVWIDNLDRSKSKAYGEALRASQIVHRHGGDYVAVTPPAKVLEGNWPTERAFVLEKYPCRAILEKFWFSDEYQKNIKPLREGSGDYTIAIFDEYRRPTP